MGHAKSRLAVAEAQAAHWASVSKLLAYKLTQQHKGANESPEKMKELLSQVKIHAHEIKNFNVDWPSGEMHCTVLEDGSVALELMERGKALAITKGAKVGTGRDMLHIRRH